MKKYDEVFEKEVKNEDEEKNITELFSTIDISLNLNSRHSERQWNSFSKFVDSNIQAIALLTVYNVFLDVRTSAEIWKITENNLKLCLESEPETYKEVIMSNNLKK